MNHVTTLSEMQVSTSNPVLAVVMGETAGSYISAGQNISGLTATDLASPTQQNSLLK